MRCHILHRDISAHNILIYQYFDSAGILTHQALLIDWGLCKFLEELERMAAQDTQSVCSVLGTELTYTNFCAGHLAIHIGCAPRISRPLQVRSMARPGVVRTRLALDVPSFPEDQLYGQSYVAGRLHRPVV